MKIPDADHPIAIKRNPGCVRVLFRGEVIAETRRALTLREAGHAAVQYIPREDVRQELFRKTATSTHCPYKGDASYYTVTVGGAERPDCAWSYEHPAEAVAAIAGHLAFYPNKVDAIEETA